MSQPYHSPAGGRSTPQKQSLILSFLGTSARVFYHGAIIFFPAPQNGRSDFPVRSENPYFLTPEKIRATMRELIAEYPVAHRQR
jgi:hypothetical protein